MAKNRFSDEIKETIVRLYNNGNITMVTARKLKT